MLTREERLELARSLCERLGERYPDSVLVAGVYGSTARGTDTPWSDLELLVVAEDGGLESRQLVYRGTAAALVVVRRDKLERALAEPFAWEYWMGVLSTVRVFHGDAALVGRWLELGLAMPAAATREALERALPWLVGEAYGRVLSSRAREDAHDARRAAAKLLDELTLALCLLNRSWVTHARGSAAAIADTLGLDVLPEGWREDVAALQSANDLGELAEAAERIVRAFRRLLVAEGLSLPRDYQTLDELPV